MRGRASLSKEAMNKEENVRNVMVPTKWYAAIERNFYYTRYKTYACLCVLYIATQKRGDRRPARDQWRRAVLGTSNPPYYRIHTKLRRSPHLVLGEQLCYVSLLSTVQLKEATSDMLYGVSSPLAPPRSRMTSKRPHRLIQ
jgi:hypothetical protein